MHKYLRSVGFSEVQTSDDLDRLLRDVVRNYDRKKVAETEDHQIFAEFSKDYGSDCGITVCGIYDEQGVFRREYYFPHFRGGIISSSEEVVLERHAEKDSFAGACDDMRVGITLIFYLLNAGDFLQVQNKGMLREAKTSLNLSGLVETGMILLPVDGAKKRQPEDHAAVARRNNMIAAAKNGDEEAIESLTMEDIDVFSMLTKRIQQEDLYSIVETYFMPHGIECDQYSLMGEIEEIALFTNEATGEICYQMRVTTNDITMDVCVNGRDLLGEPKVGRRFKGNLWLQGYINF